VDPRGLGLRKVPSVGEPHGLAEYGGTVYVGALGPGASDNVSTYDAATGRRTGGVQVFAACAVAAGALGVWVAGCPDVNRLSSRPPLKIEATTHIPSPSPDDTTHHRWMLRAMALGEGALWVLGDAADRRLWRIDPATQRIVATVRLPFAPADVAAGAGGVWVTDEVDDTVVRIEPVSKRIVAVIPVGRGAGGVAFGAGAVWVTGFVDETVSRIDPRTNRVVATIRVGGSPRDVAVGAGSVWTVGDAA
jgi:YVTN family beta-propeller protein